MSDRAKAFFINGGAGRVLASIPALEKYYEETSEDFIIVAEGGMDLYKGHPTLHERAYDTWHKGIFQDKIKDMDVVTPEPYRVWEYYNQKCNLQQGFDIEINNKGIRELPRPFLHLTQEERVNGKATVKEVKEMLQTDKVIVFQPFGRGVHEHAGFITDPTGRSFEYANMINFIRKLQEKGFGIITMSEFQFNFEKENLAKPVAQPQSISLKQWAAIIKEADYFLGCDSVGQHIAHSLDKPATVVVGSTFAENISFPDNPKFDIQDMGEGKRKYDPIRIVPDEVVSKNNDGIMAMNSAIEDEIIKSLVKNFDKHVKKPEISKPITKSVLELTKKDEKQVPKLMPGLAPIKE
jgi:ADP-heptose:LPS heptosyltransferase